MNRVDQLAAGDLAQAGKPLTISAHDRDDLRGVLGTFSTGVTVVTTGGTTPHGMTANAFTSVSLDPPLVLVCVSRTAAMHSAIVDTGGFVVSVLSAAQEHVARYFASKSRPRDHREFEGVDWIPGKNTGAPIICDTLAWLECETTAVYDGGDHSIFLGTVLDIGRGDARDALVFLGSRFHRVGGD